MAEAVSRLIEDLRQWMKTNQINQSETARRLGVRPSHVSNWLKGVNYPNGKNVLAIRKLINERPV